LQIRAEFGPQLAESGKPCLARIEIDRARQKLPLRGANYAWEEIAQHGDFLVVALDVAGDAGVEIGDAQKNFLFSGVRPSEAANFLHLGYPAIRFREHVGVPPAKRASKAAWPVESSSYKAAETPARCAARIIEQLMAINPLVIPA
jgi:hypothetical protein